MMEDSNNSASLHQQQDVQQNNNNKKQNAKDVSQQTTNLLGPGTVERVFKDACVTANQAQHDREQFFSNRHNNNTDEATPTVAATSINVSKDGRIAVNRVANISVLMLGALAADAKIMDVPSNFGNGNLSGKSKTFFGSLMSSSNTVINADNVFSALNKAGFGHLIDPCKKAIFEEVDTSDTAVLGVRRARGQV
jgi:hypothetical protein